MQVYTILNNTHSSFRTTVINFFDPLQMLTTVYFSGSFPLF